MSLLFILFITFAIGVLLLSVAYFDNYNEKSSNWIACFIASLCMFFLAYLSFMEIEVSPKEYERIAEFVKISDVKKFIEDSKMWEDHQISNREYYLIESKFREVSIMAQ